jgi:hypothetical protein
MKEQDVCGRALDSSGSEYTLMTWFRNQGSSGPSVRWKQCADKVRNYSLLRETLVLNEFLRAFAKLRKTTVSFIMSVRPYVSKEQFGSYWTDFELTSKICRENSSFIKIRHE